MSQHIVVKEYNEEYNSIYKKEEKIIKNILKDNLVNIFHIGSTSIKDIKAKPIIDIMVSVTSLKEVDLKKDEFIKEGYEYLGEFNIKGRRYLRKGGDERTHQIHIFDKNDKYNLLRHLAFKYYLNDNKNIRDLYSSLKEELAKKYPYDIESYCDAKDEFVKNIEKEAISIYKDKIDAILSLNIIDQSLKIISLKDKSSFKEIASKYYSSKWGIPSSIYLESIEEFIKNNEKSLYPRWYIVINTKDNNNEIIGGIGVIKNDFHNRKDLFPNLCAIYINENYRNKGIAKNLINYVCGELKILGLKKIYLLTDLSSFYEKNNFKFLSMAKNENEETYSKIYVRDLD